MGADAEVKESRKDTLMKAWDSVEEKEDDGLNGKDDSTPEGDAGTGSPGSESIEEVAKGDSAPEKSEKGKEADKEESPDSKEAKAAADLGKKPPAQPPAQQLGPDDKPPVAWKAGVREHWAKLPPEVRAEVNRREMEVQRTLSQTAQVRKFANDFAQVVNPYSHLIRAQNSTPLQAVNNLMATAAGLMQGTQEQKAKIVAEIIANYGIDIQTLDRTLSSGALPSPGSATVQPVPEWAKPLFGFMGNVQKMQEHRQMQMQQEAEEELLKFQEKPFFDDVREDMADLMETAANRGRTMTMEMAYEKAIALNPEIAKIVNQRKLAEKNRNPVSEAAATLARARKAASTVKGAPTGTKAGAPNGKLSRRQQLMDAWNEQEQ